MTQVPSPAIVQERPHRSEGAKTRQLGPFLLRRMLGRSSRTMAWVAHDRRVRRDVMLMLPSRPAANVAAVQRWLDAARRMSRLEHPRLMPVLDLGAWQAWPYLAVERAPGVLTLSEWLVDQSVPAALDAARWCSDALEGLAYAHEAGFAHGDLGAHSLLFDRQGRLCLWGLGMHEGEAAVDGDPADARQRRLLQADAQRDVLAVGLLLHRLLADAWPFDETDLPTAARRLEQEILRLPWAVPHPVPEALRTIVNRATDRHAQRRYVHARSLLRALQGWIQDHGAHDRGGPMVLLAEQMSQIGHLPARPRLAERLTLVAGMDRQRLEELSDLVLEDPGLVLALLRAVNAAQFGSHQDGAVTTVRRALHLVGVRGLRQAAGTLRTWPGPLRPEQAQGLERAMRRASLAGHLAESLTPAGVEPEGCLIAAVMQHLGVLLGLYHFPDDMAQIDALTQPSLHAGAVVPGMSESAAAMAVLGVDLRALSASVVQHWGLDPALLDMMCPLPRDKTVQGPRTIEGWIRLIASCANETLETASLPASAQPQARARVASRYARTLGCTAEELSAALQRARHQLHAHLIFQKMPADPKDRSKARKQEEMGGDEP